MIKYFDRFDIVCIIVCDGLYRSPDKVGQQGYSGTVFISSQDLCCDPSLELSHRGKMYVFIDK